LLWIKSQDQLKTQSPFIVIAVIQGRNASVAKHGTVINDGSFMAGKKPHPHYVSKLVESNPM